jgi:hypothetical protein
MKSIKGKEERGHASVAKPFTSLWIVVIRRNKKHIMTSRKTSSRNEGRARDTSRRSIAKLTLVKNGTPMRRVLAQMKNKGWQTLPSNPPHHHGSLPTSPAIPSLPLVSWQRGTKCICLMQFLFIMMMMIIIIE